MGLPNFYPGKPLSAADLQALRDELATLRREVDRLKGILGSRQPAATIERGVVVSRTGGGAPGTPVEVSLLTYTVRPLGADTASNITGRAPDFGRFVKNTDGMVIPAEPGDAALIIRMPDGTGGFESLIFVQEYIETQVCEEA